jgi:hypothetical protein
MPRGSHFLVNSGCDGTRHPFSNFHTNIDVLTSVKIAAVTYMYCAPEGYF